MPSRGSSQCPGWFGGHWWWIAVTAAAGAVVGLLRRFTRLPWETPGLFDDLKTEHVDPGLVPGVVAVSAVSLIGGASLGPEKALGTVGGGAGSWLSGRRALGKEDAQVNTLAGFAGAYGGLFSSTVIVVMLILEAARPGGQRLTKALAAEIVASSVSFGIYFAIAGAVFLDDYKVQQYTFKDWQLLAGVPLGLFATVVVTLLAGLTMGASRLFGRLKAPVIAKSALGGAIFGIAGVALPLTMFSGSDQLNSALKVWGPSAWACSPPRSSPRCSPSPSARAADSSAGPSSRRCSSAERPGSSSTRSSPACRWDWRLPACSPPSPGLSHPRRSRWY